jgi:hypothetical protein
MTEPDEALLWARKRMATRCDEDYFPEVAEAYRRGYRDEFLRDDIEAYRAGAAASADRIKELEARVEELEWALLGTIAGVGNHLPDSAKQHNLQVAIKVLKRSESYPSHLEAISNARSMKESDQ